MRGAFSYAIFNSTQVRDFPLTEIGFGTNNELRARKVMSNDEPKKKSPEELEEMLNELTSPIYALQKQVSNLSDNVNEFLKSTQERQNIIEQGIINFGIRLDSLETNFEASQTESNKRWDVLTEILTDIQSSIRKLDRKFDLLNEDVMEVRSDQRDANRRMDKLEEKAS